MGKKDTERLDKVLASQGTMTRSRAKELIRSGQVLVNGEPCRSADGKIGPADALTVQGRPFAHKRRIYIMLNKPGGVVCATRDAKERTVLDLLPQELKRKDLFPAGRLDKDTEGFVLITDDGELAHRMLSPRRHVPKTYRVLLNAPVDDRVAAEFAAGVHLPAVEGAGEADVSPAQMRVCRTGAEPEGCCVDLVIHEGRYHQIKRMFALFGLRVLALKRIKIGNLCLDDTLRSGCCRELTEEEIQLIC